MKTQAKTESAYDRLLAEIAWGEVRLMIWSAIVVGVAFAAVKFPADDTRIIIIQSPPPIVMRLPTAAAQAPAAQAATDAR